MSGKKKDETSQEPPDRAGYWVVAPRDGLNTEPDIDFQVLRAGCPETHLILKDQVERTLSALRNIYPPGKRKADYAEAFQKLLSLAQVGLVGSQPATSVAFSALESLQREIVDREAAKIKNAYMIRLGLWGLLFALVAFVLYVCIRSACIPLPTDFTTYRNFLLLWIGCMAGSWASFGLRKVVLGFFDMVRIEDDQVDPPLRLIFSGLLTVILGLVFITGFADFVIGQFHGSDVLKAGPTALLIGALAGISEKALPGVIVEKTRAWFQSKGGQE